MRIVLLACGWVGNLWTPRASGGDFLANLEQKVAAPARFFADTFVALERTPMFNVETTAVRWTEMISPALRRGSQSGLPTNVRRQEREKVWDL